MPVTDDYYKIPDSAPPRKLRDYPIKLERLKTLLRTNGKIGKFRLKPFVMVNGKSFYGKTFPFDSEIDI